MDAPREVHIPHAFVSWFFHETLRGAITVEPGVRIVFDPPVRGAANESVAMLDADGQEPR